jgi:glycosyltransferase involved in cell wall biosynthesis
LTPIAFICPKIPPSRDGVGDYTYCLASEIAKTRPAAIITSQSDLPASSAALGIHHWDGRNTRMLSAILEKVRPGLINIQWVPSLWGRFGFNPLLPILAGRLRWSGYRVVTTVHETYVDFDHWKHYIYGPMQRLTLWPLVVASTNVAATSPVYVANLRRIMPWRPQDVFWLPSGSNIPRTPVCPADRAARRRALGFGEDGIIVAAFSPLAAGKNIALLAEAWTRLATDHRQARLLLIGVTREEVEGRRQFTSANDRVTYTGYLSGVDVSAYLSISDMFLAPFHNGVSCKRSSVMAALQHELPVVTTRGPMTESPVFDSGPLLMTDSNADNKYIEECTALAGDKQAQMSLGAAAGEFYCRHFDWPVIAKTLTAHCLNAGQ